MEILLNPNIAYLILVFGLVITVMAILSPGSGILEIVALLVLGLVGWLIYNLSFNAWALVLLLLGIILFVLAVRWPQVKLLLIFSIGALVIGSAFLFPAEEWWMPAVNPVLALLVSVLLSGFFWIVTHKVLEARKAPLRMGLEKTIGQEGEAKTDISDEGTVLVESELWSAYSSTPIKSGARVKVLGREGFTLEVEEIHNQQNKEEQS